MASEKAVKENNLKPLARVVASTVVGVDPSIMGIGPAPAITNLLKAAGKTLNDIEIIEVTFRFDTVPSRNTGNYFINKFIYEIYNFFFLFPDQ